MHKSRGPAHSPGEPITVLIADEQPEVVESLRRVLDDDDRFRVVAVASTAEEALTLCLQEEPEVVLINIDHGRVEGVETTRKLRQMQPGLRIVAMGASHETEIIGPAIDAGASGYFPKAHAGAVLASTIERVAAGVMVLSDQEIVEQPAPGPAGPPIRPRAERPLLSPLTAREREVLELIAQGKSTRAIAEGLGIGVLTARSHVKKIMLKLGAHTRVEAVALAVRYKLVRITPEE